jgi:hypothetical protein
MEGIDVSGEDLHTFTGVNRVKGQAPSAESKIAFGRPSLSPKTDSEILLLLLLLLLLLMLLLLGRRRTKSCGLARGLPSNISNRLITFTVFIPRRRALISPH